MILPDNYNFTMIQFLKSYTNKKIILHTDMTGTYRGGFLGFRISGVIIDMVFIYCENYNVRFENRYQVPSVQMNVRKTQKLIRM